MGKKITTYNQDASLSVNDKFLGTDSATGDTKNFRILEVLELIEDVASDTVYYKVIPSGFDFSNIPLGYNNAVWVIRNNHDLGGATITLPTNVTLKHEGGVISNGTINFNDTLIDCEDSLFLDVTIGTGTIKTPIIKPVWFGAVGDGSTDNSQVMQMVSDYLEGSFVSNTAGGTIALGTGTWRMSDVIIKGFINLIGFGNDTVIKAYGTPTTSILIVENPDVTIDNILFDGENTISTGIKYQTYNSWGGCVRNCWIKRFTSYGLHAVDSNTFKIINNFFSAPVLLDGANRFYFVNNTVQPEDDASGSIGDYGLRVQVTSVNKATHSGVISGNWFETPTGAGYATAIENNANNVSITDNQFSLEYTGTVQCILAESIESYGLWIANNNFRLILSGLVLNVGSGAINTYAINNRGLNSHLEYTDNGTDTFISDGKIVISDSIEIRKLGNSSSAILLDALNQIIRFGTGGTDFIGKNGSDLDISSAFNMLLTATGSNIKFNIGGNELFELNANTNVAIINSEVTTLKEFGELKSFEFDNANEKMTIGSVSPNDFLGKNGASIELSANSNLYLTAKGTAVNINAEGTNAYIDSQKPLKLPYYTTATLPDPTLYPYGTLVIDSDRNVLLRGNTSVWTDTGVTPIAAHADSVAADVATLVSDFNGLLAKMRTSGILST